MSPRRRELVRSRPDPADLRDLEAEVADLARQAATVLGPDAGPATVSTAVDCRYRGQSHEIRVPAVSGFAAEHRRRNGYARPGAPVEVTAVRAVAEARAPATMDEVLARWEGRWSGPVAGPRVVVREDCTIWVPDGWVGEPGPLGALVLRQAADGRGPG